MNKKLIHLAEMMGIRTNNVYYLVAKLELILQLPTRILPTFAGFFAILIPGFILHIILNNTLEKGTAESMYGR